MELVCGNLSEGGFAFNVTYDIARFPDYSAPLNYALFALYSFALFASLALFRLESSKDVMLGNRSFPLIVISSLGGYISAWIICYREAIGRDNFPCAAYSALVLVMVALSISPNVVQLMVAVHQHQYSEKLARLWETRRKRGSRLRASSGGGANSLGGGTRAGSTLRRPSHLILGGSSSTSSSPGKDKSNHPNNHTSSPSADELMLENAPPSSTSNSSAPSSPMDPSLTSVHRENPDEKEAQQRSAARATLEDGDVDHADDDDDDDEEKQQSINSPRRANDDDLLGTPPREGERAMGNSDANSATGEKPPESSIPGPLLATTHEYYENQVMSDSDHARFARSLRGFYDIPELFRMYFRGESRYTRRASYHTNDGTSCASPSTATTTTMTSHQQQQRQQGPRRNSRAATTGGGSSLGGPTTSFEDLSSADASSRSHALRRDAVAQQREQSELLAYKQSTSLGAQIALFSFIVAPFMLAVVVIVTTSPYARGGCVGCELLTPDIVALIIVAAVVGISLYVVFLRLRKFPDPLMLLATIKYGSLSCCFLCILSLILANFDPGGIHGNGTITWGYLVLLGFFSLHFFICIVPLFLSRFVLRGEEEDVQEEEEVPAAAGQEEEEKDKVAPRMTRKGRSLFWLSSQASSTTTNVGSASGGGGAGVTKALTLDDVLGDARLRADFEEHLAHEFAAESFLCFEAVEHFEARWDGSTMGERQKRAERIYRTFLCAPDAPLLVNLPSHVFADTCRMFDRESRVALEETLRKDMFAAVRREMRLLMMRGSLPRFLYAMESGSVAGAMSPGAIRSASLRKNTGGKPLAEARNKNTPVSRE